MGLRRGGKSCSPPSWISDGVKSAITHSRDEGGEIVPVLFIAKEEHSLVLYVYDQSIGVGEELLWVGEEV